MKSIFPGMIAIALCMAACRDRGETVKSDLGQAGYEMAAGDWFRASRGNDVEALKKFLSGGFDPLIRDDKGNTALHEAAQAGATATADYLLGRGLPLDAANATGQTPLMAAVIADRTEMVRWLLRQGADPRLKDHQGFKPLMLAVREGSTGSVAELAAYNREDLDSALLLAALVGQTEIIDELTNYGASIYARMEDGRTPLMIAAANGHEESVKLLLDIGSSRYTTDPAGRTAADMAAEEGHDEIVGLLTRDPLPEEFALESPAEIAGEMDAVVDAAMEEPTAEAATRPGTVPLDGQVLSQPVARQSAPAGVAAATSESFPMPPLVMRHYRQKQIPIRVTSVQGEVATVSIAGAAPREVTVRAGEPIPGSDLVVVRVRRRMEDSKLNPGRQVEISVVEVRDDSSGETREWISGIAAEAHDPVALVEDAATGRRYVAYPGQRFEAADGSAYLISDVRPNQMVIKDLGTGEVRTIPLRGPRG